MQMKSYTEINGCDEENKENDEEHDEEGENGEGSGDVKEGDTEKEDKGWKSILIHLSNELNLSKILSHEFDS